MIDHARLHKIFLEHDGKISDKWEQYLSIYDIEMYRFAQSDTPVRLLEIGVQNGGSLEVWEKFLPKGSTIIGIDIDPKVGELKFEGNIHAFVCDIKNKNKVDTILGSSQFDIIIDDGSHHSSDIIKAFEFMSGRLSPGGIYFVEDLHASYWATHEGGFRLRSSSIEWLKDLVDSLNADHFKSDASISETTRQQLIAYGNWIERIAFYDSVAVIQRLRVDKKTPYRRILSGQESSVVDPVDHLANSPSDVHSVMIADAGIHRVSKELLERLEDANKRIRDAETAVAQANMDAGRAKERAEELEREKLSLQALSENLNGELTRLSNQAHELEQAIDAANASRTQLDQEVRALRSSTSWRVTKPLRWIKKTMSAST